MTGKSIDLNNISVKYPNGFAAVKHTDLHIKAGEFFSILGPSGCGKTTILKTVSGFLQPTTGNILIDGEPVDGIHPNKRPTALIFQNLALFPLMSVWENVAFGLEARGVQKSVRREKAMELLDLVALNGQENKKPSELSGGQKQRVAVARALAVEPSVLLLDEPLSALDLKLRQHMRTELRSIQKKTSVTFIYITHDQGEALTMSDRIAVMNKGEIDQIGSADEIYSYPKSSFVASFVGESNHFLGKIISVTNDNGVSIATIDHPLGHLRGKNMNNLKKGDDALIFIRPEHLIISKNKRTRQNSNTFIGKLSRRDLEGPFANLFFNVCGETIVVHHNNYNDEGILNSPKENQEYILTFKSSNARVVSCGELASTGREI